MGKCLICLVCVSLVLTACGTPPVVTSTFVPATNTPLAPTSTPSPVAPTITLAPPTAFPTPRTDCKERYPTSPAEKDYWPTAEWRVSSLAEHCLDPEKIEHAAWYLEKGITARSLLIIRHGELVYEKYFRSIQKPDRTADVRSITKSVLSALVGIAMDQGQLDSLDHKVIEYFPEYFYPQTDPRMAEVTLRHLLTMSSGFKWAEHSPSQTKWMNSRNWVEAAINLEFVEQPGTGFTYCTANTQLLSAILTKVTGEALRDYAQRNLFTPLGIPANRWHWGVDDHGYAIGGFGMNLRPRDLARFGYLYLNQGYWDGQQIISPEWIQESTRAQLHSGWGPDYGYLWWVHPRSDLHSFEAAGSGGQTIYVVPSLDLVVVITSDADVGNPENPGPIIYEWITKAVTDR
ncbi:6-aminohexanoate-dimer hydrolase [Thermoflexales bacterium]|nr:6-aminohexanoate-dimer hydrolase [Thermoflexales bacterium]